MELGLITFLKIVIKILLMPVVIFLWYVLIVDLKEMLEADFSPISKLDIAEYLLVIIPIMYFILFV